MKVLIKMEIFGRPLIGSKVDELAYATEDKTQAPFLVKIMFSFRISWIFFVLFSKILELGCGQG